MIIICTLCNYLSIGIFSKQEKNFKDIADVVLVMKRLLGHMILQDLNSLKKIKLYTNTIKDLEPFV